MVTSTSPSLRHAMVRRMGRLGWACVGFGVAAVLAIVAVFFYTVQAFPPSVAGVWFTGEGVWAAVAALIAAVIAATAGVFAAVFTYPGYRDYLVAQTQHPEILIWIELTQWTAQEQ